MKGPTTSGKPGAVKESAGGEHILRKRTLRWPLHWLFILIQIFMMDTVVGRAAGPSDVLSGILESINEESNTVQIRNALNQPIFLKITKLHLLEGITPGERVTVVVNEQHEIIKLIETPIPELPPPTRQ